MTADSRLNLDDELPPLRVIPEVALAQPVSDRAEWQASYVRKLETTDAVVVCLAVFLGQIIRFGPDIRTSGALYLVSGFSVVVVAIWLIALSALRSRSRRIIGTGIEEYRRVVAASFWTFGAIAIASLLFKFEVSRGYLAIGLPIGVVGLLASRLLWRKHMARRRSRGLCQTQVLIVGERAASVHFADELMRRPEAGYRFVGITIPGYGPPRGEQIAIGDALVPVLGDETHLMQAIAACQADTVAIAGTEHFGVKGIRRLLWDLEPRGVDLMVSTGVMDVALSRLVMRPTAGIPVMHIEKPQYQGAKRFQKRLFDVLFSSAALLAAAPVMLLAALAIKLTSRGPVFYSAERIGIEGEPFAMLKFRSMVQDADKLLHNLIDGNESDGLLFKMRQDPRVTPVGRVLRRLSIDELPQFINVLLGHMSVVGPRPPLRREVSAYDNEVSRRLLVKPGVTGLWQVSGRSDLSWEESVRLDLSYVDNWSMVGDVLIAAKTVSAVLRHQGAY